MIRKMISERFAGLALIVIFSLTILFHLAVIAGLVPMDMIWGGRLKTQGELYVFESISIVLNAFMLWIVTIRMNYFKFSVNPKVIRVVLWLMFLLFLVNTLSNLMAFNNLETYIFTPITFILALLSFRLAIKG
ncbi:hypothetical protein SanaruYs_13280 [Chryseotalea sanaruensis]|uniref:Uncharacterized protein n=1 Tax=Chryseotalea sanaruensis TaxID=2482724 RepID=A0A401U889_9BACT|nr:hypothetical protein [Chryseotalea sanaruensis]GCC51108.1 hypothetical protein SanaruYs_13280 [Chryseotalea sanaruensis]